MSEQAILAPLDSTDLLNRGLLRLGGTTGTWRLHKRRLNRSSDEENHHIPMNIPLSSRATDNAFATIPVALISYETLIYIGLSAAKAAEVWDKWSNWPAEAPRRETDPYDGGLEMTFEDFVIGEDYNQSGTLDDDEQQWRECLDFYGIAIEVQNAIMDPHFEYLRLSQSCIYWINDTLKMRYAGLQDIQRSSRERDTQLRRTTTRSGGNQGANGQGSLDATSSLSLSASQGERSVSGFQQQNTTGIEVEIWGSTSATAARNIPGHLVLFKGLDQARITGLFDEAGVVDNIATLASPAPSDFSRFRSLYYFTPDYKVAEFYAAFAKQRAACESVVIICLSIPKPAIEDLSAPDIQRIYWPSNEWKELIWRCRAQKPLPSKLLKYEQATLVIGSISQKSNYTYRAMDSWKQVTENHLLRSGRSGQGRPAIQYAFSTDAESCEFLMENGARNIRLFSYTQAQLQTWLTTISSSD